MPSLTAGAVEAGPSPHELRARLRDDMNLLVDRLVAEFGHALPAGTVIRHVARAREELLRAGVRAGLAAAAESMARHRLQALVPAHVPVPRS